MSATRDTLVLAWGNPGRLDDGLGPSLAAIVEDWGLPGVEVHADYQLQIEDAELAAGSRRVIFVDADRGGAEPFRFERLAAERRGIGFSSHSVAPGAVLALSRDLYGAEVEGFVLGIRGYRFDGFGEALSEKARSNLAAAASFLRERLEEVSDG